MAKTKKQNNDGSYVAGANENEVTENAFGITRSILRGASRNRP
ncbi:hypothetical protein X805_30220 [Sphaerotilus natans subsp. natans DSM 6575]|uniref:Uncharacterized protein n=1 Tax=Sphaerotilus natans subsp. natans DSM 6575 TaxID=1286631 RepID=A0A059KJT3_9BURK|nr:hypothetical protein X805_30220 [Sphaerotilus natans subsp. natans DSM 6575]